MTTASNSPPHTGDRRAWLEGILREHLPWIRAHVHRRLPALIRKKLETGDIVQDALVQFLRYGPRFDLSDPRRLRGLLARIVENVLHDKYDWFTAQRRAIARERPLPGDTVLGLDPPVRESETPSRASQQREDEAWVRLGLELLPGAERETIVLKDWEGLSFAEIADHTGCSKSEARRRYLSALESLVQRVTALRENRIDTLLDPETG